MLNTSGCAFSISSSNTTEYGLRRTALVSVPESSYPTYPGGAPISRLTENFSMYSDISTRISAFVSANRKRARPRASSVLPTPVGPEKMKEPIGRLRSEEHTSELQSHLNLVCRLL